MTTNKRLDRGLIFLLTWTVITAAIWVSFEIYRAYTKPRFPEIVDRYLKPIEPKLDMQVLDRLQQKKP